MKWLTWDKGRQVGRYSKLLLATSKRLKFDMYIIKIPDGSAIMEHRDPALEGYEHHRFNLFLNRFGRIDNNIKVQGPSSSWMNGRAVKFRPDLYLHSMRHIDQLWSGNNTYILSIGWLKKEKNVHSSK